MQNFNNQDNANPKTDNTVSDTTDNQLLSQSKDEVKSEQDNLPHLFSKMDLSEMSTDQLKSMEESVKKERQAKCEKVLLSKWSEFVTAVADADITITQALELCNPTLAKGGKKVSKIKYRNPDRSTDVWTGRGRKPQWFLNCVEKGIDPKDMEI